MQSLPTSVGPLVQSSKLGKSYWEAVGPMRKLFIDELAETVKDYLDRCLEPPAAGLYWSMYMRGRTPGKAKPYLVFSSTNERTRKRALRMVREKGILAKFPAIRLKDTRYTPEMSTLMRLLGDEGLELSQDAIPCAYIDGNTVYYIPSGNVMSLQLYVRKPTIEEPIRQATAGGVICVGGSFFYLTVYHILERNEHQVSQQDSQLQVHGKLIDLDDEKYQVSYRGEEDEEVDDSGFEDSIQSDSDGMSTTSDSDNGSGDSEVSMQLSEEHMSGACIGSTDLDNDPSFSLQVPPPTEQTKIEYLGSTDLASSAAFGSESLNYLLIKLQNEDQKKMNRIDASHIHSHDICVDKVASIGNEDRKVIIPSTSHGISKGALSATPRYMRLAGTSTTRKAFALQLDRDVQPGECGSWVVDEVSGHLYGHIFGGGIGTRTAYIIPADDIFEDIERKFRQPVFLPSVREASHTASGANPASTPSRVLQAGSPPGSLMVSKSMEKPAVPREASNQSQLNHCNIISSNAELPVKQDSVDPRGGDVPQLPCTRSQYRDPKKAAQILSDKGVSSAPNSLPTLIIRSEPPEAAPTSTCAMPVSSKRSRAYLTDKKEPLRTFRQNLSRSLFYYASSSRSAGPEQDSEEKH
ncbi:uncharacterized protein P174DRAFT_502265 [Aspergillus novofumigatus IBT 16806]|uniref:Uncharacterized protein n=1 Tax=Aspergillus novofumigatus (strain IBT 16806) TaxID=1392255 RepID=A0A2I1CJG2_ASPN1|nr:uncharacterized protein P174DRAFT_502265 [Aspergillus novofumigatus IBT 16806]PKX97759.1 hypothetical protein P174DRAFT_502265 [Aspergillus novofumigatus IBT 16806]